jgi:hypothetical protein
MKLSPALPNGFEKITKRARRRAAQVEKPDAQLEFRGIHSSLQRGSFICTLPLPVLVVVAFMFIP